MKFLLIVMGTLVALLLLVVVVGMLLPKTHLASRSAVFKTTPEQLFAFDRWTSNLEKQRQEIRACILPRRPTTMARNG